MTESADLEVDPLIDFRDPGKTDQDEVRLISQYRKLAYWIVDNTAQRPEQSIALSRLKDSMDYSLMVLHLDGIAKY